MNRRKGIPTENSINRSKELMKEISKIISQYKLTQTEIANVLNVSQARVSNLANPDKHFDKFSIDKLFEYLDILGEVISFKSKDGNKKLTAFVENDVKIKREKHLNKIRE